MTSFDEFKRLLEVRRRDRRQLRVRKSRFVTSPDGVGTILRRFFEHKPHRLRHIEESRLCLAWAEIVGETIARVTQATCVRDGRLYVRVADPLWRTELVFQKSKLLTRLKKDFPHVQLKDIFFAGS